MSLIAIKIFLFANLRCYIFSVFSLKFIWAKQNNIKPMEIRYIFMGNKSVLEAHI